MATIEPLTTLQITSMDPETLATYSAQLSAAISTAMDTSGYTYETLSSTELDLLSPSELYTYSINFSSLRGTELYNKSLIDTAANIATYQAQLTESTIQGISTINYSISLEQAAADAFNSTSRALYSSAISTVAGLDIEISQNTAEIAAYDSQISFHQSTIKDSNNIVIEELSAISSMAVISRAIAKRATFYTARASQTSSELSTLDTQLAAATASSLEAAATFKKFQYDNAITNVSLQAAYYTASVNGNISAQSDITIEVANYFSMCSAYGYKESALLDEASSRKLALKNFSTPTDPLYISTVSSVTRITTIISSCQALTSLYSTIIPLAQQVSTIFIDRSAPFLASEDLRNQIIITNAFIEQNQVIINALAMPIVSDEPLERARVAVDAKELEYDTAIEPEIIQIEKDLTMLYTIYNDTSDKYAAEQAVYNTARGQILPLTKEMDRLTAVVLDLNQQLADAAPGIAGFDVSIANIRNRIREIQTSITPLQATIDAGISAELPLSATASGP
jgi:chromosome segregation ATPase